MLRLKNGTILDIGDKFLATNQFGRSSVYEFCGSTPCNSCIYGIYNTSLYEYEFVGKDWFSNQIIIKKIN